jgi:transposase
MTRRRRKGPSGKPRWKRREIHVEELLGIVERTKTSPLTEDDREKLTGALDTLQFLTRELEAKGTSIARLRRLLFGPSTEKTSQVLGETEKSRKKDTQGATAPKDGENAGSDCPEKAAAEGVPKQKRKGHGRNGASDYTGAEKIPVSHATLNRGDACPDCEKGKVYIQAEPSSLVRIVGMAPLHATVYELERLRCNLCGKVFTAESPEGVGTAKYDETGAAMVGVLKYGCGLPFNRLQRLQEGLGMPLPASTQWELVDDAADLLAPAYSELICQAAQGEVLYNDDTTMKILELTGERRKKAMADEDPHARTGVFTSGIVATGDGHQIALFFTGSNHAGENLTEVLSRRAQELSTPIQMCDALSRNKPNDLDTILANCMAHARRRFVEVVENFPEECSHVLEILRSVYQNDAEARENDLDPQERLRLHQARSGPLMEDLKKWLGEQIEQKRVEPNSGLGQAIGYMLKYWSELTLFLREPGAPLDNNICERALKKAILHRKNSLFYKTENGARVGDLYMSLIHTAELCGADPFVYLVTLQRHADRVERHPWEWMPWNYQETLSLLAELEAKPR